MTRLVQPWKGDFAPASVSSLYLCAASPTTEGVVRDSAALGRDAERAPAGVPTLGAADAGSDGPDGIRKLSNDAMYRSTPEIRRFRVGVYQPPTPS